ncbi:MAG: hypothetical protein HKN58_04420, partial [Xanthomonadales bacterium]|nr:hypothetical protein [Xanthomonadales bacterium]
MIRISRLAAIVAVTIGAVLLVFRPAGLPQSGLDPSWSLALENAFLKGLDFGEEIVFTFGPLGFAYANLYHPETLILSLSLTAAIASAWAIFLLSHDLRHGVPLLAVILLFCAPLGREFIYLALPLMALLLTLRRRPAAAAWIWAVAGLAANIKFSFAIGGLFLSLLADSWCVLRKKPPFAIAIFGLAVSGSFLWANGGLATFPDYLRHSLTISSGYSEALAIYGPPVELFAYVASALLVWLAIVASHRNQGTLEQAILALGAAGFLFLATKAGFVRHDAHSFIAWSAATAAAGLVWLHAAETHFRSGILLMAAALLMCGLAWGAKKIQLDRVQPNRSAIALPATWMKDRVKAVVDVLTPGYTERMRDRREAREKSVTSAIRLTADRSYDVLPSELSGLILSDADYSPRPVPQSYAAMRPDLAELNRAHIHRRGPASLLVTARGIDNHWPTLDDGPVYGELIRHYDPVAATALGVEFRRRQTPRTLDRVLIAEKSASLGEWMDLNPGTGADPAFATVTFETPLAGRLKTTLFKSALYFLEARLADGRTIRHRIAPSMTASEFLLTPYVNGNEIAHLLGPKHLAKALLAPVVQIRVLSRFQSPLDPNRYTLRLEQVRFDRRPEHHNALADGDAVLLELMDSARYSHPISPRLHADDGLLTHADMRLSLRLRDASRVRFVIGMRDGSWQHGSTDGVAFSLWLVSGAQRRQLMQRDLDPAANPADRGDQPMSHTFERPTSGVLEFVFDKKDHSKFD